LSAACTQAGARSDFGGLGVRAGEKGLAGADDPEYRRAAGEGRAAARHFHAAHGEIRFADEGKDGTSHFGDLDNLHIVSPISMLGDLIR